MHDDHSKTGDPAVGSARLVGLLGKTYSIYSMLSPEDDNRMPYVLINAENRRLLRSICMELNRLRKQSNKQGRR
jgi:hypothetical protein